MSADESPMNNPVPEEKPAGEHINVKVTDNNNEIFFKIKRTTPLGKLMNAFCDRTGKDKKNLRFLFDGQRLNEDDTPEGVSSRSTLFICHLF